MLNQVKRKPQNHSLMPVHHLSIPKIVIKEEEKTDTPQQPVKESKKELRKNTSLVRLLRTAVEQTSDKV